MLFHKKKQLMVHYNHMNVFHNFVFLWTILLPDISAISVTFRNSGLMHLASPNQYARKYFRSSLMLATTYPLLSNYSTCLSPMSTLSLNWGMLLLEPLFGTPMMATLESFPKIQICQTFPTFQTRSKRQNRAGNHTYCPCYFSH